MDNNTSTDFENDDSSTVPASPLIFHEGYIEEPNYDLSFSSMNNNSFVSTNDGEEYEERNINSRDKERGDSKNLFSPVSSSNSRRESLQSYRGMSYNSVYSNSNSNNNNNNNEFNFNYKCYKAECSNSNTAK
ncbi:unnamed protein product [[Candida] boidinii]|nr:unnamed protein product [[Candida] boidinii]